MLASVLLLPEASAMQTTAHKVQLKVGESARIASSDRTVTFVGVDSDGRCPKGVTCVWEGDAVVRLSVGASAEDRTIVLLHTHPDAARDTTVGDYVVTLGALDPYPSADTRIDPRTYLATLVITPARR